jgi:NAD-dependent SIR2 family protein deacetylase
MSTDEAIEAAARVIREAEALLVTAGAGMGVDSGLPDFRGTEGFWRAYPAFAKLRLRFEELASPSWFGRDPALAWGFYGHRLGLYRETVPHAGFEILRRWGSGRAGGVFVFTSNVDGQFGKAGFDAGRVMECHGSIHHLQCARPCSEEIWAATGVDVAIDPETMRAGGELPRCPRCGEVARPNVLMFGDGGWVERRMGEQWDRYSAWLSNLTGPVAVVELGAGEAVPTVRRESERVARKHGRLIRINPRDTRVPAGQIAVEGGAMETLRLLDGRIQ